MPGTFIDVQLDASVASQPDLAQQLEDACPVDIFANRGGRVAVVEENLDECVLCALCVRAAPEGTVRVTRLYDPDAPPLAA